MKFSIVTWICNEYGRFLGSFKSISKQFSFYFVTKNTGNTAAEIPVFGIDFNTGIPVLGIGIGSFNHGKWCQLGT